MRQDYWQTFYENSFYHVYNRTNNKELLFIDYADRSYFMVQWQAYLSPYVDTYAYCLMSNHFHFVIKVKTSDDAYYEQVKTEKTVAALKFLGNTIDVNAFLEDQFKRFFTSYVAKFNKKHNRNGSLFQKRFKRIELITLAHILDKICYVHHNPLHHDAASYYEAWEFSSYRAYISDKPTKICRFEGLRLFDDRQSLDFFKDYHDSYHENWVKEQLDADFDESGDI